MNQSSSSAVIAQALYDGKLMPRYGFNIKKKSLMEDKRKYKA